MKIFIVGLPLSGRSTVAIAIANEHGYHYIDAVSWVRSTFREPKDNEHPHQFDDEYNQYLAKRLWVHPDLVIDHVQEMMKMSEDIDPVFIIDGISSPKDFTYLFNYREDTVVFLNRTDNAGEYRDHENIGVSVIRDYCFWMAASGLIDKKRWLEYNFRIPGDDVDGIKEMGAQNSLFIVKSINKAISHLKDKIKEIANAVSQ